MLATSEGLSARARECFVSNSETVNPPEAKTQDLICVFTDLQRCRNCIHGRSFKLSLRLWLGNLRPLKYGKETASEEAGAEESPEPSELAEETLLS